MKNQPICLRCDHDVLGENPKLETICVSVRVEPDRDGLEVYINHLRGAEEQAKKKAATILTWLARRNIEVTLDQDVEVNLGGHFTYVHVGIEVTERKYTEETLDDILRSNRSYDTMLTYAENDFWEGG